MRGLVVLALLGLVSSIACGPRTVRPSTEGVPWATSGVDWTKPPPVAPAPVWQAPKIHERRLTNGVRILVVENPRSPLVAVAAIHTVAGSRNDLVPGVAGLTADVLDEGRGIEGTVASDYAAHHVTTTAPQLAQTLAELAAIVRDRAPTDEEIVRVRDRRVVELTRRRERARTVAAQTFDRVTFRGHPYALPAEGTPEHVGTIEPKNVRAFIANAYHPEATTIILAGAVTHKQAKTLVDTAFGSWNPPGQHVLYLSPIDDYAARLAYVDVPGAREAIVIVGRRTTKTGTPDQLAADVASSLLGAGTDGVLDRVLHAEKGYTFGASASFWRGAHTGSWSATATFRPEVAADGIRTMLALIETARTTEPTTADLGKARANMLRASQQTFETVASTARAVERLVVLGHPLDWYATLDSRLAALTPAQVRNAVTEAWRDLTIVIVGDWTKLRDSVSGLRSLVVPYTPAGLWTP